MFEQYKHHGTEVWVRSDVRGKHNDYCLCYSCHNFKPNQEDNCPLAQENYEFCVKHDLLLPVWECPLFKRGLPDLSELGGKIP